MSTTRHARALLALSGLIALAFWLPIAAVTYLPGWHDASCDWHQRCDNYGREAAHRRIDELRLYMQHRAELPAVYWTPRERSHLAEVRTMLEQGAAIAFLGALVFFHADARERRRAARTAACLVAACAIVLPFFGTFWREIFHPLLFDNQNWRTRPEDSSYWVMPRVYFLYTTGLVIAAATLVCVLLWGQARVAQGRTGG